MKDDTKDRARLKAAHDIAVMEYGQGWVALLTLKVGRQSETELIKNMKTYFKRNLPNKHNRLSLHRSVYIHRIENDIHAHAYIRPKYDDVTIGVKEELKMRDCWLMTGSLASISDQKRQMAGGLLFDLKLLDNPSATRGSFGEYGIKQMLNEELVYECSDYKYEGVEARTRGTEFMELHGHRDRKSVV